ncbi:hypothetical protein LINPERPRIM_LOCUS33705 [Linum perenne]
MRKMKGVTASASAATGYEDPRIRFKHESLMQDYDELLKESEDKRKRFEVMKQKKMTLMAEVSFLRRRFNQLAEIQAQNAKLELQSQTTVMKSKKVRNKGMNSRGNDTPTLRQTAPKKFDLNRKGKAHSGKESISQIDLNQKQKSHFGREASLRDSGLIPDLNEKERMFVGKEVAVRNSAPIFDLNEISREEEELQTYDETIMTRMEDPKITSSLRGGIDEQHNDVKLSACRNMGNVPSRAGKRKISWQDPVALRV